MALPELQLPEPEPDTAASEEETAAEAKEAALLRWVPRSPRAMAIAQPHERSSDAKDSEGQIGTMHGADPLGLVICTADSVFRISEQKQDRADITPIVSIIGLLLLP